MNNGEHFWPRVAEGIPILILAVCVWAVIIFWSPVGGWSHLAREIPKNQSLLVAIFAGIVTIVIILVASARLW